MKKETIIERITKAEEFISKKQNTIIKKKNLIQKKSDKFLKDFGEEWMVVDEHKSHDIYWAICDIRSLQSDIRRLEKEIDEKKESLQKYQEDLQKEIEKDNSRNITVILQFLDYWKEQVTKFYQESLPKWEQTLNEYYEIDSKTCDFHNYHRHEEGYEETLKTLRKERKLAKERHETWKFLDSYVIRKNDEYVMNMEVLQKDLNEEANRKYDFIIERTNKIVGQITDASNLSIGHKGDLNGFIIGTRGTAKVQTIGAGGYNIQCYHFRTLINKA